MKGVKKFWHTLRYSRRIMPGFLFRIWVDGEVWIWITGLHRTLEIGSRHFVTGKVRKERLISF